MNKGRSLSVLAVAKAVREIVQLVLPGLDQESFVGGNRMQANMKLGFIREDESIATITVEDILEIADKILHMVITRDVFLQILMKTNFILDGRTRAEQILDKLLRVVILPDKNLHVIITEVFLHLLQILMKWDQVPDVITKAKEILETPINTDDILQVVIVPDKILRVVIRG